MERLRDLPGLGPKSEAWLVAAGIETPEALRELGAVRAFIKVKSHAGLNPGLNLLYALAGAIEGKSWLGVARHQRGRLLMELEGYRELEALLKAEGIEI